MKIYYIGNICSEESFQEITKKSRVKPSVSGQVFEYSLLNGLAIGKKTELSIHTFLTVACYPDGSYLFIPRKKEKLKNGLTVTWYPSVNLPVLKQWGYSLSSFFSLFAWLIKNRKVKDKAILCYSIFSCVAKPAQWLGHRFHTEVSAIVTDLPAFHFSLRKVSGLRKWYSSFFIKSLIRCQDNFDNYIFLTEQMNLAVNTRHVPYMVMEGICDSSIVWGEKNLQRVKSVMYAGMVNQKHRIKMILDAFMSLEGNYELWIFGTGDYEKETLNYTQTDNRIKYFGRVDRQTVLDYERRASLLINVRDSEEEYTKYSFPSKTIEYMASGTPVLTTRLAGIPEEYFKYCYVLEDESVKGLSKRLQELLSYDSTELSAMGESASRFVKENKSAEMQGERVLNFLKGTQG